MRGYVFNHENWHPSRATATLFGLTAVVLFLSSLIVHGPAWLVGSVLRSISHERIQLNSTAGRWYSGHGRLQLKGATDTLPLKWQLSIQDAAVQLTLSGAWSGTLRCGVTLTCATEGLHGRLPVSWLLYQAPTLASVSLDGTLEWQINKTQLTPEGGALDADWHSDSLYSEVLELPLGRYSGSLRGSWSSAEHQPRVTLNAQSAPLPGQEAPLDVTVRGTVGPSDVDLEGNVQLPENGSPRWPHLLRLVGMSESGGHFKYRSGR